MLYGLKGTPFIYQGEELGLPDATIPPDRVVDVDGRDPERAPIPWTPEGPGYGFTTADSAWLPFVDEAATLNAATQAADPHSTLNLTKAPRGPADHGRPADARRRAGHRGLDPRRHLPGRGQLHRPGAPAATRQATLVISSDPASEAASASLAPSEALILRLRG